MNVVINSAYGSWYPKGQKRLVESLRSTGYDGDILTWTNEVINKHHDPKFPYTMKAAAFVEAIKKGYTRILWIDSSVYAIKNIEAIFQEMEKRKVYFWKSGWNLAQTAADSDLNWAGITRDEAELLHECASGIVGINLAHHKSRLLMSIFLDANLAGVCSTSRFHDNQSKDPRFKFARQDQTAFTIAFHKAGFKNEDMFEQNVHCSFVQESYKESVSLVVHGL